MKRALAFMVLAYDPVNDFAPVSLLASVASVLVAHPALPVNSMKDPIALPHIEAKKLKALGITATKRNPGAPQIPTMAEAGLPARLRIHYLADPRSAKGHARADYRDAQ